MRHLFIATVAFGVLSAAGDSTDVTKGLRPPVIIEGRPEVSYTLAERMKHHNVPAVSIALIRGGKLDWASAWGELEVGGRKADAETLFQAASISKPVAALAALHMAQFGNFELDEDVNLKLKSWKVPSSPFDGKVTLRRLLNHSAGLTVHGFRGYAEGESVPTAPQLLDGSKPANSAAVRVDVAPGSIWRYSGGGYTVMQLLLTDKSGLEFPALMQKMVLGRIGMTHSTYEQPLPTKFHENAARGHRGNGQMVKGKWHQYPEMAAAGLWTTPSDLALMLIEVRKAARGESNRILEKATALEALKRVKGDYGLGFGLSGEGDGLWYGHGGSNEGFKCDMQMNLATGDGIAVMTNGDAGAALSREIFRSAATAYGWSRFQPERKKELKLSAAQLKNYEGAFEAGGQRLSFAVENGTLFAYPPRNQARVAMVAVDKENFVPLADGMPGVRFVLDGDGPAKEIEVNRQTAKRVADPAK